MKPRDPSKDNRNDIPDKQDKIKPFQDPDLAPGKNNPVNPETDEPNVREHKK